MLVPNILYIWIEIFFILYFFLHIFFLFTFLTRLRMQKLISVYQLESLKVFFIGENYIL